MLPLTEKKDPHVLLQYSGIEAFDLQEYDGSLAVSALGHYGDFGLGCFNALDGELIHFGGKSFHATSDGHLKLASPQSIISCGYFTHFSETFHTDLSPQTEIASLFTQTKAFFTHPGQMFCAIQVYGHFETISMRSVPPQKKPYPTIDEVVKGQALYSYEKISATLIGFYFPSYFNGLTYPGFHLHFVTEDLKHGGHVLNFKLLNGKAIISPLKAYVYLLPDYAQFA